MTHILRAFSTFIVHGFGVQREVFFWGIFLRQNILWMEYLFITWPGRDQSNLSNKDPVTCWTILVFLQFQIWFPNKKLEFSEHCQVSKFLACVFGCVFLSNFIHSNVWNTETKPKGICETRQRLIPILLGMESSPMALEIGILDRELFCCGGFFGGSLPMPSM